MRAQRINKPVYPPLLVQNKPACALVALLILVLSACSGNLTPRPPTGSLPATQAQAESTAVPRPTASALPSKTAPAPTAVLPTLPPVDPSSLRGVSVTFWHPWGGRLATALRQAADRFNAGNEYGISVTLKSFQNFNDLYAGIAAASAPAGLPDVVVASLAKISGWQADGTRVVDLNPYVNDPQWGLSQSEQEDFYPLFWQQEVVADKRLGLPAQRTAQVMLYNQSWAEELGFEGAPYTTQAFKQQACVAAQSNRLDDDPDNDGSGGWAVSTAPTSMLSWLLAFGGQATGAGGHGYSFDTPAARAAFTFLKDLSDNGCTWQVGDNLGFGEGGIAGVSAETAFAARRALLATASLGDLPAVTAAMAQADNPDRWAVLGFPGSNAQPTLVAYGPAYAVFQSDPARQLAAWLFVKAMLDPAVQVELVPAGYTFALQESVAGQLGDFGAQNPGWAATQGLLDSASPEPQDPSWDTVRWVLSDVGVQTFRPYFTAERIPAMLELLQETAEELDK